MGGGKEGGDRWRKKKKRDGWRKKKNIHKRCKILRDVLLKMTSERSEVNIQ